MNEPTVYRPHERTDLPFICADSNWSVIPSGDDAKDYETGLQYGRKAIEFMDENEDTTGIVVDVFQAMIQIGRFGYLQLGFLDAVARAALYYHNSLRMGAVVGGCFGDLWPCNITPSSRLRRG